MTEVIGESGHDRTEPVDIQVEMQRSYIEYAMSVIVGRALPDVRDGLKPVHVRILYAMLDGGYRPAPSASRSDVQEPDVLGVAGDERAARLDVLAHQHAEQLVGLSRVV